MAQSAAASWPRIERSEHQRRVDEIQAEVRSEAPALRRSIFKPPPPKPEPSKSAIDHRMAEEIECIRRHLELIGGALVNDPLLLHRYSRELQSIDLVNQLLGHLAAVVAAEDKEMAVGQITLQDLRARLLRKPLRPMGSDFR